SAAAVPPRHCAQPLCASAWCQANVSTSAPGGSTMTVELMTTDNPVRHHRTPKYVQGPDNGVRTYKSTPESIALQLRTEKAYMHVELSADETEELIARLTAELAKGLRRPLSRDPTPEKLEKMLRAEKRNADHV